MDPKNKFVLITHGVVHKSRYKRQKVTFIPSRDLENASLYDLAIEQKYYKKETLRTI